MSLRDEARALLGELAANHRQDFAPRPSQQVIRITGEKTTNAGGQETYQGLIDGEAIVTVTGGGVALGVGDIIMGQRTDGSPLGAEYAYVRILASDNPAAGYMRVDANIPYPEFDSPASASLLIVSGGSITASLTIKLVPISETYRPSRYVVSWRLTGTTEWRDEHVPHIVGATSLPCQLSVALMPGQSVDVKLRAEVNYAQLSSPEGPTQNYVAVTDSNSPAALTSFSVSSDSPGQLVITPLAVIDSDYFLDWEYSFATSATGTGHYEVTARGPYVYVGTPGQNIYIAVRARARNFSYGNRLPSSPTAWAGPYTYEAAEQLDQTAPPTWNQPTLVATNVQSDIGGERPQLQVTFPVYSYPADYDHTIVRLVNGSSYDEWVIPYRGVAHDPIIRPLTGYGTWHVTLQGQDRAGNRSTASTDLTTAISPSGVAAAAGDATTSSVSLGVKVAFTKPANATIVKIWRATSVGGAGAAVIGQTDSDYFLDLLAGVGIALSQYWYKVQGTNLAGDGTISPTWVPGTVGAYDGSNVAVGTMEANVLKAATTLTSLLRTATSGTRWEIEGHTGGGLQDQIRAYEAITGVDKLRVLITGAGLFIYNDSAAQEGKLYRDSTGHAHFSLGVNPTYGIPAIDIAWDNGLSKFISSLDIERAQQVYKSGATSLYVDSAVVGTNTQASVQFSANSPSGEPIAVYKHLTDAGLLYLLPAGIGVYVGATNYTFGISGTGWTASAPVHAPELHAGGAPSYVAAWPATVRQASSLGYTAANSQPLAAWQYPTGNMATLRLSAFRGATVGTSDWQEARFRLLADIDNLSANGGGLDLGFKAYAPFFSLHTGGTARLYWDDTNTRILIPNDLRVDGAMSAGTKPFEIPHPDRDKNAAGLRLRHVAIEGPTRGDTICRFAVLVPDDQVEAEIATPLPDFWRHLNEDAQCWVSPRRNFGRAWAEVDKGGESFTLAADRPGWYEVLVMATRTDAAAVAGWDDVGGLEYQANDADRERQHLRLDSIGRKIAPRKVAV